MMTTRMRMTTRKNSFLIITLLLVAALLHASDSTKKPYALIFGTVYGANDRPAYGVKIKIRRADQKKLKWELTSDHAGEFAQRVPAGKADYVITAEHAAEVKVHVDNDERKDVSLHLQ
jgi:hypothetical protein